jgi:hypothetical protein
VFLIPTRSPAQLSTVEVNDVLVRVDSLVLRSKVTNSSPPLPAASLSDVNTRIRGVAGTSVELEFVTEGGEEKTVTLLRVAAASPGPARSATRKMPEGRQSSGPSYGDMKTPREKILFRQFLEASSVGPSNPGPSVPALVGC